MIQDITEAITMNSLMCLINGHRAKPDERPSKPHASTKTHHSPGSASRSKTQARENLRTQRSTWYNDLDQFNSNISVEQGTSSGQQQASPLRRPLRNPQPNISRTSFVGPPPASNHPSRARPRDFQASHQLNPDGPFLASNLQNFTPPPSSLELDRLNHHRAWSKFRQDLQNATNAVFSQDRSSRYTGVDVILLSWQDEDPRLPVSLEIRDLDKTFTEFYGFDVKEYLIPSEDSHNKLQARILDFLGEDDPKRLKIVYYGGHGKLTNHGMPAWTSQRNRARERCPTVKWSGIQNTLEESRSDVLILLDCCASGVCTADEGNGATELIAACAYNAIANGVGSFSFTHALNAKLRSMAQMPYLNVGYLYNSVFFEVQSQRIEDSRFKKAPIHLVLNQNLEWPRSIRLPNFSQAHLLGSNFSQHPSSLSMSSTSQIQEYPRLLFSVRIQEDINPNDLSAERFAEWLRQVPLSTNQVRVEASFKSDSTLLMVSMPIALHGYLRKDPAIQLLGTIRSRNCIQVAAQDIAVAEESLTNSALKSQSPDHEPHQHHEQGTQKKPAQNYKPRDYKFPPDIEANPATHLYQHPNNPLAPNDKGSKRTPAAKTQLRFPDPNSYETKNQHKYYDIIERTVQTLIQNPEKLKKLLSTTEKAPNSMSPTSSIHDAPLGLSAEVSRTPSLAGSEKYVLRVAPEPNFKPTKKELDY